MGNDIDDLTLGVEEELFLVEKETGNLCKEWPKPLWEACRDKYPGQIIHEFLNAQAELISKPHSDIESLANELLNLRQFLTVNANEFGLAPMACSTHPRANWHEQTHTDNDRYDRLANDLQISADRMLVCGMHIHVGLPDDESRLKLLNELTVYLPMILALTTSSPFWAGEDTGLMSYRATIVHGLPRAGLPPLFPTVDDYERYLNHMVNAGAIESGKELWWDLRISSRFPTVEVRIADTCSSHKDVVAVIALVKCLARHILSEDASSVEELAIKRLCATENRWRVQRYPIIESQVLQADREQLSSLNGVVENLVKILMPHAKALDCETALTHCLTIAKEGTSADKQRQAYQKAIDAGLPRRKAMMAVMQFLMDETVNF